MTIDNYTQPARKWTKESIIAGIKANSVDGYCKTADVGMALTTMAKRLFGSFDEALRVSGSLKWSDRPKSQCCASPGCKSPLRSTFAEYCETHYYRIRRNGTLVTTHDMGAYDNCQYCSTVSHGKKFCDHNCRNRHSRGLPVFVNCTACGESFRPFNKSGCCSDKCHEELARLNSREWYAKAMLLPKYKNKVRAAEYKRKALKVNAYVEHVDVAVVFRRDKGICWLCNEKVDPSLKWPNLGFGTLDHIVPLARGGMHSYGNIKLAHLSCNCRKGPKQIVQASMSGAPAPSVGQAKLF